MAMVIKVMARKAIAMVMKDFNIPDIGDDDDDNDGDEGEENGDGDGDGDEDRSTVVLTLAWRPWSVRPASRDGDGDKGNGDEGDGDEGDGDEGNGDGDGNTGGGYGAIEQVTMVNGLLVLNNYVTTPRQLPPYRQILRHPPPPTPRPLHFPRASLKPSCPASSPPSGALVGTSTTVD